MIGRHLLLLFCLPLLCAAVSADTVRVDLPQKGAYELWFEDAEGSALGEKQTAKDKTQIELSLPERAPKNLVVRDEQKENLAVLAFAKKPFVLKTDDFKYVAELRVRVEHKGKPVASAIVVLEDAERTRRELLSPDMNGVVPFHRVRLGTVTAQVTYRVEGKERQSGKLTVEIAADRPDPIPVLSFAIPEQVAVVGDIADRTTAEKAPSAGAPALPGVGGIVTIVLALLASAGVLYGIFRLVQARESKVRELLEKHGIRPPAEESDAAAQAAPHTSGFRPEPPPTQPLVPEGHCPFCGSPKAPDGSCACVPTAAAAAPPTGKPRLVVLAGPCTGRVFELASTEITLGRELDCEIALSEDPSVSRRHSKLSLEGGELWVEDLGSTNGTFLNGVRTQGRTKVSHGDTLQFGESRVRYEG